MTKQFWCEPNVAETNLVQEAKRIVIWAWELTQPGEAVGGIGTQNKRASELLRLPVEVIKRARYERVGPAAFPTIEKARDELIKRLAQSPWATVGGRGYVTPNYREPIPVETQTPWAPRIRRCG